MKLGLKLAIAFVFLSAGAAHAGFLDDLNKAVETVKKVSATAPAAVPDGTAVPAAAANDTAYRGNALLLPFDLPIYPRARQARRIDNPLERVRIPISTPQKTPDGYLAAYSVPMEGKVTMLQFQHRSDDSPLLIRQHYEAWLAQAGFERLLVCDAPCPALPSHWDWRHAVDPTERLDSNDLPEHPTYIAAYKADAMALVGIGKRIDSYSSLVKVVEGRVLDAQPWKTLTTPRAPAPPVPRSRPATPPAPAPLPEPTPLPVTASADAGDGIEMIASADLSSRLAASKGFVILQLSSFDPNCPFCVQVNPKFDELAARNAGKAVFWRAMWQPWLSFSQDPFPKAYGVNGLPTTFTFKNGQLVRRSMGNLPLDELEKQLVRGLR